ncbi:helix-turn-helix domain-containing protein [Spongiimicrobium salis]|uniref:helix-turn-helix domain-containing protein n=1 Tax=Spongiimicrobium salis TaxID=1667022 RepID=UPI00374CB006
MVIDRINNWFNLSKQFFFTYKDNFFHLSYVSNCPEAIVKSCIKMPFMKHYPEKQLIHSNTPFMKGDFLYAELEKGLWVLLTDSYYKNNLSFNPIYDKFLSVDYYFVATSKISNVHRVPTYRINNMTVANKSISFCKPGKDFQNFHFKNSNEILYMLYFNEEWAEKNILDSPSTPEHIKSLFKNDDIAFLNYAVDDAKHMEITDAIFDALTKDGKPNFFELKKLVPRYLESFYTSYTKVNSTSRGESSSENLKKIKLIEHELMQNLHGKFPGIETLARKHKISPTTLKKIFKNVFGSSVLSYFTKGKMDLALKYLMETDVKIKEVAQMLGYENKSKFSQAFKKIHGKLPSEIN